MGTSAYDSFGDRVPRYFKLLHDGKWDDGMELYWSYQAAREAKGAFHATFGGANLIHRVGWKYLELAARVQRRLAADAADAFAAQPNGGAAHGPARSGFKLPEGDDGFYTGRFPVETERGLGRRPGAG